MTTLLRHTDDRDVAGSAEHSQHQVLDLQHDVRTLVLVTRTHGTKVVAHQHDDGSWELRCEPTDSEPFTLTCPPQMPYMAMIRLLEIL